LQKKKNAFVDTHRIDTDIDEHPKEDDEDGMMQGALNNDTVERSMEKSLSGTVHFPPIMQPRQDY